MRGYALIRESDFVYVLKLVTIVERHRMSFRTLINFAFEPEQDAAGIHPGPT